MQALIASWPAALAGDDLPDPLTHRVRKASDTLRMPYWLLFPQCVADQQSLPRQVVEDILVAQYCLFLSIRLQDDVLDGQRDTGPSVYAPTLLLLAAHESLQGSPLVRPGFWDHLYGLLRTSVDAITRLWSMRNSRGAHWQRIRLLYVRQNAVLKVGMLAVCHGDTESVLYRRLSRCADHCAVAGQLLDDLVDLDEDRRAGRWNSADRAFQCARRPRPGNGPQALGVAATMIERYLSRPKRELHAADRILRALHLSSAREYIDTNLAVIGEWEHLLRRARTNLSSTNVSGR